MIKDLLSKLLLATTIGIITMLLALVSDHSALKSRINAELVFNSEFHREIRDQLKELRTLQFRTLELLNKE